MKFRVHYTVNDVRETKDIEASEPAEAAKTVRKTVPNSIVHKTKLVRGDK